MVGSIFCHVIVHTVRGGGGIIKYKKKRGDYMQAYSKSIHYELPNMRSKNAPNRCENKPKSLTWSW
jgi:hypothetical protein